jgi:hypothetical protein
VGLLPKRQDLEKSESFFTPWVFQKKKKIEKLAN